MPRVNSQLAAGPGSDDPTAPTTPPAISNPERLILVETDLDGVSTGRDYILTDGTEIHNNDITWTLRNSQPAAKLLDGDRTPVDRFNDHIYVEVSTNNGPNTHPEQQGWVSKEDVAPRKSSKIPDPIKTNLGKAKSACEQYISGDLISRNVVVKAYK